MLRDKELRQPRFTELRDGHKSAAKMPMRPILSLSLVQSLELSLPAVVRAKGIAVASLRTAHWQGPDPLLHHAYTEPHAKPFVPWSFISGKDMFLLCRSPQPVVTQQGRKKWANHYSGCSRQCTVALGFHTHFISRFPCQEHQGLHEPTRNIYFIYLFF